MKPPPPKRRRSRWHVPEGTPEEQAEWGFGLITPYELSRTPPPLEWLITGLWPEGSYGPWGGAKKTLKTYSASIAAIAVAAGMPAFNNPEWAVPRPRPVIYYAGEGGQALHRRRLQRIAKEVYGVDLASIPLYMVTDIGSCASEEFWNALQRNAEEVERAHPAMGGVGLVVLDSLYNYHPQNIEVGNLYERGRMLARLSAPLTDKRIALWVVDHFNKGGSGIDLDRLAQSGMAAWADSWCLFDHGTPKNVAAGRFTLNTAIGSRQWGGEEWTLHIDIGAFDKQQGTYQSPIKVEAHEGIGSAASGTTATDLEGEILALLASQPDILTKTAAQDWVAQYVTAGSERIRQAWEALESQNLICSKQIAREDSTGRRQRSTVWAVADGRVTKVRVKGHP